MKALNKYLKFGSEILRAADAEPFYQFLWCHKGLVNHFSLVNDT
jgi:hypothetical protein